MESVARPTGTGNIGKFLLLLLLVTVVALVILRPFASVREIVLQGALPEDEETLLARSGLFVGMPMRTVDTKRLSLLLSGVGAYEHLDTQIDGGTVTLFLRRRNARAVVHNAGSTCVIDERVQVMEKTADRSPIPLLEIRGMDILSAEIGKEVQTADKNQSIAVSQLIAALDETGLYSHILECDVSDLDTIRCMSVSGIRCIIGDVERLDTKCRFLLGALHSLGQEGRTSGSVDASTGMSAVYSPG